MDLVQLAESVAQSPYGLPLFLLIVVYYTAMMIQRKDTYMEAHIKDDLEKAEDRLKWHQNYLEALITHVITIENDVRDMWEIMREGGVNFENRKKDHAPCVSAHDDTGLDHLRIKLSAKNKEREYK